MIVELLEMIDIDQQQRERSAVALRPRPFVSEALVEMTAIGDAGEPVWSRAALA